MNRQQKLLAQKQRLNKQYKTLIELAYNLRQTDHAMSDVSEYKALKILRKINGLSFLDRNRVDALS